MQTEVTLLKHQFSTIQHGCSRYVESSFRLLGIPVILAIQYSTIQARSQRGAGGGHGPDQKFWPPHHAWPPAPNFFIFWLVIDSCIALKPTC